MLLALKLVCKACSGGVAGDSTVEKRNLEGNNPPSASYNHFFALSNTAIMIRASLMGVKLPDD